MARKRLTRADYQLRLDEKWPGMFEAKTYTGSKRPVKACCTSCGKTSVFKRADHLLKSGACPKCRVKGAALPKTGTRQEIENCLNSLGIGNIRIDHMANGACSYTCNSCGGSRLIENFSISDYYRTRKPLCTECNPVAGKLDISEMYAARFASRAPNLDIAGKVRSGDQKVSATCHTCGHSFKNEARLILHDPSCWKCQPQNDRDARDHKGEKWITGYCKKHGRFSTKKPKRGKACPKCRVRRIPFITPENIAPGDRMKPCVLYLLQVKDRHGVWMKVGISTNLPNRLAKYKSANVRVLRRVRVLDTTLLRAVTIEQRLKRWARKNLGRRKAPSKKWSGWSESFKDSNDRLKSAFDLAVQTPKKRG